MFNDFAEEWFGGKKLSKIPTETWCDALFFSWSGMLQGEIVMTRSKIDSLFEEFKFLQYYFDKNRIHEVKVMRADDEVLDLFPSQYSLYDQVWLLDKYGTRLVNVGSKQVEKKWYRPSTWSGSVSFHENVTSALLRLGDEAKKVQYVLACVSAIGRIEIFKSPKGFNLHEWLEEVRRRDVTEAKKVRAEIDQV